MDHVVLSTMALCLCCPVIGMVTLTSVRGAAVEWNELEMR